MKIIFPSIEEMLNELTSCCIVGVRLVTTDTQKNVLYGAGDDKRYLLHHYFDTIVTAVIAGTIAECVVRHAVVADFEHQRLTKARKASLEKHQEIEQMIASRGFTINPGMFANDEQVFIGTITKEGL